MKNPFRNAGTGSKDVLMMLDSLGYKYQILGDRVMVDTTIINEAAEKSYQNYFDSFIVPLVSRLRPNRRNPQVDRILSTLRNMPPIKRVEFVNLFADMALIVISSVILFHFLFYSPTAIGEIFVLAFIGFMARDLARTLIYLRRTVTYILAKKYKFQKNKAVYEIRYFKLLRTLIKMKYREVVYSLFFLSIFLLGVFFRYAPIQFVSETIDFIAIFFAIWDILLRGLVSLKVGESVRSSPNFYLSTAIGVFFLILFIVTVATHNSILYYFFVIFEGPLLIIYFLYAILDVRAFPV